MSVRAVVRTLSEICVTVGTLIVLFVVYVLYWTGVQADSAMAGQVDTLERRWAAEAKAGEQNGAQVSKDPAPLPASAYVKGKPFAVMYIPRFGSGWTKPVLHGTATGTLNKGLGHYAESGLLGAKGNFAVAGHRRTHGDPLKDFPKLRAGDAVVLSDGRTWYTYRIDAEPYRTLPSDTGVVSPVPRPLDPEAAPYAQRGRYLTLTTCEPEWGHSHRLIVWAHLDGTKPVSEGKPSSLAVPGR